MLPDPAPLRRTVAPAGPRVAAFSVLWVALLAVPPAYAQDSVRDVLSFLLTNRSIPTDDFVQDAQAAAAARDAISDALLTGLTTVPVGSSATGFTYRVDSGLGGVAVRSSNSFGPFFTERSLTAGRFHGSVGVLYGRTAFDTLDDRDLRDGRLVATASSLQGQAEPFDVETLTLRITTDTITFAASYGLSDRVDISTAIPFVRLSLEGQRVDNYRGRVLLQASGEAEASGLGDVLVRVKYNARRTSASGIAVGIEARLPTGDEENLLGAGEASVRPRVVWSLEGTRLAVDADIGYSVGGLSDELGYGAGVTLMGIPRLTLSGEIAGRTLRSAGRLTTVTSPHPELAGIQTIRLSALEETSNRLVAIGGLKWNPAGNWLVGVNVQRRLTTAGLTAPWVPTVGVEYAFGG
jgi:hypothetical protein